MQKQFPEIEEFFRKEAFSEDELNHLKDAVELKYGDRQVGKAASSLIGLHLVKFQMNTSEKSENRKPRGLHRNWKKVKDESITQIAERFGIPLLEFLNGLEKLGFVQGLETQLTFKEFKQVYIFITEIINEQQIVKRKLNKEKEATEKTKNGKQKKYRRAGTGTIPQKKLGIKTYNTTSTRSVSVFDKIHGAGGLGRIIYTRM